MTMSEWAALCEAYPLLLYPLLQLQGGMHKATLGEKQWSVLHKQMRARLVKEGEAELRRTDPDQHAELFGEEADAEAQRVAELRAKLRARKRKKLLRTAKRVLRALRIMK